MCMPPRTAVIGFEKTAVNRRPFKKENYDGRNVCGDASVASCHLYIDSSALDIQETAGRICRA